MTIDVGFDFRSDATSDDPDRTSPTLRLYHQLLWGKRLPDGSPFDLEKVKPPEYLHHRSELGEFFLSSDSVIATYRFAERARQIVDQLPDDEVQRFDYVGYTIGGTMVFPSNRVDGKPTINGACGFMPHDHWRPDGLTLSASAATTWATRAHPRRDPCPLCGVLALFQDFRGYVDHFLLQDLVTETTRLCGSLAVRHGSSPVPANLTAYLPFRDASIASSKRATSALLPGSRRTFP